MSFSLDIRYLHCINAFNWLFVCFLQVLRSFSCLGNVTIQAAAG